MSQLSRFSRARQLTASVWSGKATDDYESLVAARLRKLAAADITGMLPFSGTGDGAIYFRDGTVVLARSTRTPGPSVSASTVSAVAFSPTPSTSPDGLDGAEADGTPFTRLAAALTVAEPTIDATVDLLSSESRFGKFRSAKTPVNAAAPGIGLEDLLTEVARRQRILHQLAPVVTADTVVARNPFLSTPDIGVLAPQWALLVRVRDGSTPRALAWELGRSVFGTTLEVYRLLALRLLSSADHRAHRNGQEPRYGPATMSFVRAVAPEEGGMVAGGVPVGAGESNTLGGGE
jgi:hypothetical protein